MGAAPMLQTGSGRKSHFFPEARVEGSVSNPAPARIPVLRPYLPRRRSQIPTTTSVTYACRADRSFTSTRDRPDCKIWTTVGPPPEQSLKTLNDNGIIRHGGMSHLWTVRTAVSRWESVAMSTILPKSLQTRIGTRDFDLLATSLSRASTRLANEEQRLDLRKVRWIDLVPFAYHRHRRRALLRAGLGRARPLDRAPERLSEPRKNGGA